MQRALLTAVALSSLALVACTNEPDATPYSNLSSPLQHSLANEEEVWSTVSAPGTGMYVAMVPLTTQPNWVNQSMYFTRQSTKDSYWGWFGINEGPECGPNGGLEGEMHWDNATTPPADPATTPPEAHCLNPGQIEIVVTNGPPGNPPTPAVVDGKSLERPVDFVNFPYFILNGGATVARVEDSVLTTTVYQAPDARFDFNPNTTGMTNTESITYDVVPVVSASPWGGNAVSQSQTIHGPSNFWFRFNASNSTSTDAEALIRYFWDANNPSDRSGFANAAYDGPLTRVKRFAQGTHVVTAQMANSSQFGGDAANTWGTTMQFTVDAYAPLTVVVSPSTQTVTVGTQVQVADAGSNGAGSDTYNWAFGDGGSANTATATHTYTSVGTYHPTLTKTDANGYSTTGTGTIVVNPVAPPTNLTVSNVTASGATVGWTMGTAGATTTVQYRVNGGGSFTTAGTAAANVTTFIITGLGACTTYDVNLYHTLNGQSSVNYTTNSAFTTTAASGVCAPTNFTISGSCTHQTIKGKDYTNVPVSWTQTQFGLRPGYDIASNTTNDPNSATIVASGTMPPASATVGPFPSYTGAPPTYLWVRQKQGGATSAWVAEPDNPVVVQGGC